MPGMPIRAGQVIAHKYRVDELLGSGSSGLVVAAKHVWLRYPVCLKILAAYTEGQLEILERQIDRARIAMRLRGKHIARIRDIGLTQDKMPYVATELFVGKSLEHELAERERLPITEAVRIILEACEGLAEAHAIDLVHGDLKPANLFLADKDGERILKILDFGMMSPIEAIGDAGASTWFASPAYLAPELIQDPNNVDPRADIWSLGVILYQLISGRLPFDADTVSGTLVAVVMDEPPFLTDAPYELALLLQKCLSKSPDQRPADVATLAKELARFADEEDAIAVERVKEALASPPPTEPPSPDEEEEELAPASRNSTPPIPLVKRRGAHRRWEGPTAPSQRVLARRRERIRNVMLGAIAIVTGLALASIVDLVAGASAAPPALLEDEVVPPPRPRFEPRPYVPSSSTIERPAPHRVEQPSAANRARPMPWRMAIARPLRSHPAKNRHPPPSRRSEPPPSLPAPRVEPDPKNLFSSRK